MTSENRNFSRDIIKLYLNNPEAIRIVFDYKLNSGPINSTDNDGNNLLHHIVLKNDIKTLTSLVNGSNVSQIINHQNNRGDTPIHIAVRNQNEEIAKMLDNNGADLKIKNSKGENVASSEEEGKNQNKSKSCNMWKHLSTDFNNSINLSDLEDSSIPVNRNRSINNIMIDGKNVDLSESERFIKELAKELVNIKRNKRSHMISLSGGGADSLPTQQSESTFVVKFADDEQDGGAPMPLRRMRRHSRSHSRSRSNSRTKPSESSDIHDQVVAKLKELTGNEDDARAIKSGLYNMVKEQNPEASNLERAKLMQKYMEDQKIMKGLMSRMDEFKAILANVRKMKEQQGKPIYNKDSNNKSDKPKSDKPKKSKKADV